MVSLDGVSHEKLECCQVGFFKLWETDGSQSDAKFLVFSSNIWRSDINNWKTGISPGGIVYNSLAPFSCSEL